MNRGGSWPAKDSSMSVDSWLITLDRTLDDLGLRGGLLL